LDLYFYFSPKEWAIADFVVRELSKRQMSFSAQELALDAFRLTRKFVTSDALRNYLTPLEKRHLFHLDDRSLRGYFNVPAKERAEFAEILSFLDATVTNAWLGQDFLKSPFMWTEATGQVIKCHRALKLVSSKLWKIYVRTQGSLVLELYSPRKIETSEAWQVFVYSENGRRLVDVSLTEDSPQLPRSQSSPLLISSPTSSKLPQEMLTLHDRQKSNSPDGVFTLPEGLVYSF